MKRLTKRGAVSALAKADATFITMLQHGTMKVEWYKPVKADLQTPHAQDEIYVVVSGSGLFFNDGERTEFRAGDVLFVPAGKEHRFEMFTDDFATWVIFYGPDGGEEITLTHAATL